MEYRSLNYTYRLENFPRLEILLALCEALACEFHEFI